MYIETDALENGYFAERFGALGTEFSADGSPRRSPGFTICDPPEGTRSYALYLEDLDSIPVCGFAWIHWTACNICTPGLPEDASATCNGAFVQGATSRTSPLAGGQTPRASAHYGGMAPPDRPHRYDLHIYALDTCLNLPLGFYANELFAACEGHILAEAVCSGYYRNRRA